MDQLAVYADKSLSGGEMESSEQHARKRKAAPA